MKGILPILERGRVSILSAAFLAAIFLQAHAAPAVAADNYSAAEKIYLKTVTPILYEYSQVASQVSANVLPLQSAPLEKCSGEFAHYYGIMSSLGKQLGTITPPARFESVQANSASAISEYETSLNLYSVACTQEDFGTKEELVSRAGAGVNRSVATIGRVYKEIEDLGAVAAAPPAASGAASENLSESAIETAPSGEAVEDVYVEEQTVEAAPPPAPAAPPAPKTREEVIKDLAEEVDTGGAPEAAEVQKPAPAAPVAEAPKPAAPPAIKAPEPVKPAPPAPAEAQAETAKIETSEETLPLPPPPAEPAPVETKKLPEPEKPEAVQAKPEPVPAPEKPAPAPVKAAPVPVEEPAAPKVEQAPVKETASVQAGETAAAPAPAEPEKPAPAPAAPPNEPALAPEPTLIPAPQEGAATAGVGPQPLKPGDAASETVTEKSMDTAALAPEDELKEEALPEDEINSWCSRYQTDFERTACVKKRTEARDKTEALSTSFEDGTPEKEIVEKCRADWKEGITYNYEMVVSCTQFFCGQKGLEACKELSK